MPLTRRGRALGERLPGAVFVDAAAGGCRIVHREEACLGCGRCAAACPGGARRREEVCDPAQLLAAPAGSRRGELGAALRVVAAHAPSGPIVSAAVPDCFRAVTHDDDRCLGCGSCVRACPTGALEALPPEPERPPQFERQLGVRSGDEATVSA